MRNFSPLPPEERHRRRKDRIRRNSLLYARTHGKPVRTVSPKVLKALESIDQGTKSVKDLCLKSGLSKTYILYIKKTLRMRGSRKASWCEHKLTKLLAKIEEVRRPIPHWLRPYSAELHKLYAQCEDVMAMMKRP